MGRHSATPIDGTSLDWRRDRLGAARSGDNPMVLAKMRSGYAVIGDTQFLPGYCVLLADADGADHLTDLDRERRAQFLADMGLLGEAIAAACNSTDPAFRRINYEILGNHDHYLHAHLFPRYAWEPPERRQHAVSRYPLDRWHDPSYAYAEEHEPLRETIVGHLHRVMTDAYGTG